MRNAGQGLEDGTLILTRTERVKKEIARAGTRTAERRERKNRDPKIISSNLGKDAVPSGTRLESTQRNTPLRSEHEHSSLGLNSASIPGRSRARAAGNIIAIPCSRWSLSAGGGRKRRISSSRGGGRSGRGGEKIHCPRPAQQAAAAGGKFPPLSRTSRGNSTACHRRHCGGGG